jgi:hypothetical protein
VAWRKEHVQFLNESHQNRWCYLILYFTLTFLIDLGYFSVKTWQKLTLMFSTITSINKKNKSDLKRSKACISSGSEGVKQVTLVGSPHNGNSVTRDSFRSVYSPQNRISRIQMRKKVTSFECITFLSEHILSYTLNFIYLICISRDPFAYFLLFSRYRK